MYNCVLQDDVTFTRDASTITIRRPEQGNSQKRQPTLQTFELPNGGTKVVLCDEVQQSFRLTFIQTAPDTLQTYIMKHIGKPVTYDDHYGTSWTIFFLKAPRITEIVDDCEYQLDLEILVATP